MKIEFRKTEYEIVQTSPLDYLTLECNGEPAKDEGEGETDKGFSVYKGVGEMGKIAKWLNVDNASILTDVILYPSTGVAVIPFKTKNADIVSGFGAFRIVSQKGAFVLFFRMLE